MAMQFHNNRRRLILCCAGSLALMGALAQTLQRGPARSPHGTLAIPCANCHTSISWSPLRAALEFSHTTETRYPLRNMHQRVPCRQCHTNLTFRQTPVRCADCHADIHRRQFGARCDECHTVRGWQVGVQAVREHSARFPLIGAHAAVDCEACHRGAAAAQYIGLSVACGSCHAKDYDNATTLNHRAAGFPLACDQCHAMDGWLAVKFDHARYTGFALLGTHASLSCTSCHIANRYQGTPAACFGCHAADFAATRNPNHVTAGFSTNCSLCHSSDTWTNVRFDHAAAGFPLTGAHATVACSACHLNGQFVGTPIQCAGCHLDTFKQTTNPNHVSAGFPTDCSLCHTTVSWQGAVFDHSKTGFALTGAHAPLTCAQCHTTGQFTGLNPACVSCHLANYNATKNPNHVTAGFPQQCDVCHSTTAWTPASFNHNLTAFPLTGAHVSVPCASCHIGGVYAGTPTDCYTCHKAVYQSAANPNHVAAGFPTTCTTCHNTTTWTGATFTHSRFPIYSGTHANRWTTCADCHTNPSNYQVFSCITCHTHDQASTDPHHRDVRNYVYSATSCYSCHPTGRGGD